MLYLVKILNIFLLLSVVSLISSMTSYINLIINTEFIIFLLCLLIVIVGSIVNISWLIGFSFCILLLSGLELSLSLLLLVIYVF